MRKIPTSEMLNTLKSLGFSETDYHGLRRAVLEGKKLLRTDRQSSRFSSLESEYTASDFRYALKEGRRQRQIVEDSEYSLHDTH